MILDELEKAETKHPKFADFFTTKNNIFAVQKSLKTIREVNSEGPYDADIILREEVLEATEAYLQNDRENCLKELAQCGAVILRCMEMVEKEMN